MSEEEYSRALSALVFVCVDVVVISEGKIFLAKRKNEPMSDWWFVGGRMQFGEMPREAAARLFERETGLKKELTDFKYFANYMLLLKSRAQVPREAGTHDITLLHALNLAPREVQQIILDKREYTGETQLVMPAELEKISEKHKLPGYFKVVLRDLKAFGLIP